MFSDCQRTLLAGTTGCGAPGGAWLGPALSSIDVAFPVPPKRPCPRRDSHLTTPAGQKMRDVGAGLGQPLLPARAMQWSSSVPAARAPGEAAAGDLPGSPGHSSPGREVRGGAGTRPELSTMRGALPQAPLLSSSDPWRGRTVAFLGTATFCLGAVLPAVTMEPDPSAGGFLSTPARFAPAAPPRSARPGRRAGNTGLGRGGPACCDQHTRDAVRAAPGRPRRAPPLRARGGTRASRAVVPAGGWCRAG